jgi:hypothetical protein
MFILLPKLPKFLISVVNDVEFGGTFHAEILPRD